MEPDVGLLAALRRDYPTVIEWTSAGSDRWTGLDDPKRQRTLHALTDGSRYWAVWVSNEFRGSGGAWAWRELEAERDAPEPACTCPSEQAADQDPENCGLWSCPVHGR